MYFVALDHTEQTATFHFCIGHEVEDLGECYHNFENSIRSGWLEEDDGCRCYANYCDADAQLHFWNDDEGVNYEKRFCPLCFRNLAGKVYDTKLKVNVVVFAERCVGPDILVTFDDELAMKTYLDHDRGADEYDLISWQELSIKTIDKGGDES